MEAGTGLCGFRMQVNQIISCHRVVTSQCRCEDDGLTGFLKKKY